MMTFFTILGFIGATSFALCTLPQILRVKKRKSTADISLLFVLLSLLGNLTSASYILYTNIQSGFWQIPQYFNYTIATTLVITLLVLKLKYDREQIKYSFVNWWNRTKSWIKYDLPNKRGSILYYIVQFAFGAAIGFWMTDILISAFK